MTYRDRWCRSIDHQEWLDLMADKTYRIVAEDRIDGVIVRTVWEGFGVAPGVLFVTGISRDGGQRWKMERTEARTETKALAQHQEVIGEISPPCTERLVSQARNTVAWGRTLDLVRKHVKALEPATVLPDGEELADQFGVTGEVMNQILQTLEETGVVKRGGEGQRTVVGTPTPDELFQQWRTGIAMPSLAKESGIPVTLLSRRFKSKMHQIGKKKILLCLAKSGPQRGRQAIERIVNEPRLNSKEVLDDLVLNALVERDESITHPRYALTEAGWVAVRDLEEA